MVAIHVSSIKYSLFSSKQQLVLSIHPKEETHFVKPDDPLNNGSFWAQVLWPLPPIPNHSVLCNGDKKHPSSPAEIVGVGGRDRAELPIHDSHTFTLACSTWLIGAWSRDTLLPPQIGGQCKCKRHVSGRQCNQCQHGFYKLQSAQADGCRACNCNTAGTVQPDITCHQDSGQCQCKANVIGTYQAALRPPSLFRSLLPSFSSSLSNFFFLSLNPSLCFCLLIPTKLISCTGQKINT